MMALAVDGKMAEGAKTSNRGDSETEGNAVAGGWAEIRAEG